MKTKNPKPTRALIDPDDPEGTLKRVGVAKFRGDLLAANYCAHKIGEALYAAAARALCNRRNRKWYFDERGSITRDGYYKAMRTMRATLKQFAVGKVLKRDHVLAYVERYMR